MTHISYSPNAITQIAAKVFESFGYIPDPSKNIPPHIKNAIRKAIKKASHPLHNTLSHPASRRLPIGGRRRTHHRSRHTHRSRRHTSRRR